MQPSKWDLILGQKPVPLAQHLLEEVSKLFAQELGYWPPRLLDDTVPAVVAEAKARPPLSLYRAAFTLTRFELAHELEAYDDFLRNQRWLVEGLHLSDKAMLLFLTRFITEQVLALAEATEGRLKRPQLRELVDSVERRFLNEAAVAERESGR